MAINETNTALNLPNLLLIAGNGRNVGKTFLARKIIQHISETNEVIGLKIASHFHSFNDADVIFKSDKFIITDEKQINSKDSSLMLQAGAKHVFFVMVKQENLLEAFYQLQQILQNKLVVCESGGLRELVSPGIFLFVKRKDEKLVKSHFLKYNPILVQNYGNEFDFEIQNIEIRNNTFKLKN